MKVLAIVPHEYDTSPGQRFRIEQWEPFLRERGVEITYSSFTTPSLGGILYRPGYRLSKALHIGAAYLRQCSKIMSARRFDLVYLFREAALIGPAFIESAIAWQRVPIVFDFDDAIFVPYKSPSNGYLSYLKCFGKTGHLCRLATHVLAGNAYLADYARQYNSEVSLAPTTIDTDQYRLEPRDGRKAEPPVIGWTGSHSTLQHLQTAVPALSRLAKRHPFRLVAIGAEAPDIEGVDTESRPWCASSEVEDLSDIDVGIMPLPDDPWSRGKCGLKALQYMALGIPPVVSPVGVNTEIVEDNVNGLVAGSEEQWIEKLTALLTNAELRHRLGRAARQTVEERYSARVIAPRVFEVFEKALSHRVSAQVEAHSGRLS
ncbi:MAG: glycosyltransferase family 4 protein [Vicinamibacteria bacterium]